MNDAARDHSITIAVEEGDPEGAADQAGASAETISDAAAVAVATAGAAAALAQEVAAHAELEAAEEVAEVAEEQDAWRTAIGASMAEIGQNLTNLSERQSALSSQLDEQNAAQMLLLERLLALEEAETSQSSTPPASAAETETTATERTEAAPLVGTEAAARLGPASAEAGGAVSLDSTARAPANPNAGAKPRVLRRWI